MYTEQQFIFLLNPDSEFLYQQSEDRPLCSHKKYCLITNMKMVPKARNRPLLHLCYHQYLHMDRWKKKGEVWPQKLADVNMKTKHMAALAGTRHLADSLFPPTSLALCRSFRMCYHTILLTHNINGRHERRLFDKNSS